MVVMMAEESAAPLGPSNSRWRAAVRAIPLCRWMHRQFGRRGGAILVLAAMDLTYGAALATTYAHPARWWPASLDVLFGVPTHVWGWIWVGVGLVLVTGAPRRRFDRWQLAISAALKSIWAGGAASYWFAYHDSGTWGLFVLYCGLAGLALIISGWRDPLI